MVKYSMYNTNLWLMYLQLVMWHHELSVPLLKLLKRVDVMVKSVLLIKELKLVMAAMGLM